ncbi:MAG: hypothetical protein GX362_02005 [Methanosarcinaceae archaeon]|nr:hypothetical protein [Methanosarcinaceae archaeon]
MFLANISRFMRVLVLLLVKQIPPYIEAHASSNEPVIDFFSSRDASTPKFIIYSSESVSLIASSVARIAA